MTPDQIKQLTPEQYGGDFELTAQQPGGNTDVTTDYSDLPRAKMRKISIAFDVDGTLRCNCTDTCQDPNKDIVELFRILGKFKNTKLYVWSGGGAKYAYGFAQRFGLNISQARCLSKFGNFKPDIAIDDIQETDLGNMNLIVKEK